MTRTRTAVVGIISFSLLLGFGCGASAPAPEELAVQSVLRSYFAALDRQDGRAVEAVISQQAKDFIAKTYGDVSAGVDGRIAKEKAGYEAMLGNLRDVSVEVESLEVLGEGNLMAVVSVGALRSRELYFTLESGHYKFNGKTVPAVPSEVAPTTMLACNGFVTHYVRNDASVTRVYSCGDPADANCQAQYSHSGNGLVTQRSCVSTCGWFGNGTSYFDGTHTQIDCGDNPFGDDMVLNGSGKALYWECAVNC